MKEISFVHRKPTCNHIYNKVVQMYHNDINVYEYAFKCRDCGEILKINVTPELTGDLTFCSEMTRL